MITVCNDMIMLDANAAFLVSKVGSSSARAFAARLAPLGVDPREFALLDHIGAAEGRSQRELSDLLRIPASRMVALADGLEQRGLLERRRGTGDRRVVALHLTAAGRKVLTAALEQATAHEDALCADLAPDERSRLVVLLQRLAAGQDLPLGVHPAMRSAQ